MTTALSQTTANAPPQLPGSTVLQFDSSQGGAVLTHDLGSAQTTLYARLMVNAAQASGGSLALAGGIDALGFSAWQLVLDADTHAVQLNVGDDQASATFPSALDWHCIEIGLDTSGGAASLRIDGIERDTLSTTIPATRYGWVGGAFADAAVTGEISIDHWVLTTEAIGVPIAEPTLDHAGDPRRWLIVYNRDNADSAAWAEQYRARRGVPYANLCGLDLSMDEVISMADYLAMRQMIGDYLDENNLRSQIVGVLLGLNVPGYVDDGLGLHTPTASYLHTDDNHTLGTINPIFQDPVTTRPTTDDYASVRLTGRVDAANLAEAIDLLDRADAIMATPLSHDGLAEVLIDINPDNPNVGPVYTDPVAEWAGGTGLASLRLPGAVYDEAAPAGAFADAVVWGWRDAAPPSGYFMSPAGRRALCIQLDPEPVPAVSVRTPSATDWLTASLAAGYAAAAAPSRPYSLTSVPQPRRFFEALRLGWTIAEAWAVAQAFLRDGLQIVGDPLMTVGFPRAGYDVFGPADRVDQIDHDQPIALLHAGERSLQLDPADAPADGLPARYVVERRDDDGRADHANAAIYVAIQQGQPVRPALPAWPGDDGWRINAFADRINLHAIWPLSLRSIAVDAVQLQSQVGSDDPQLVDQVSPKAGQHATTFTTDRPLQTTRYRFRIIQGSASFDTPWSQWVDPAAPTPATLTVLEGSS